MNFSGATLQPSSYRSATPLASTPPSPADSAHPPMRRGLAHLGAVLADSSRQLSLLQRLTGPYQQCFLGTKMATLGASGRSRFSDGLLPQAYGVRPKSQASAGVLPYEPIDRAFINAKRNAEEAKRLAKNYDDVSAAQLRRARQAALGQQPAGALGLMLPMPTTMREPAGAGAVPDAGSLATGLSPGPGAVGSYSAGLQRGQPPSHSRQQQQYVCYYRQQQQQQHLLPQPQQSLYHDQQQRQQQQPVLLASTALFSQAEQQQPYVHHPEQQRQPLLLQPQHAGNGRQLSTLARQPDSASDVDCSSRATNHHNQHDGHNGNGVDYPQWRQQQQQQQQQPTHEGLLPQQQQQPLHHEHLLPDELPQQQQEAEELSEYLMSVLWEGHVRTPEQTAVSEVSTSGRSNGDGGGGTTTDAVPGLLGSRRHKAATRNDILASVRRTYKPLLRRKPPPPPPPHLTRHHDETAAAATADVATQLHGNGDGGRDTAAAPAGAATSWPGAAAVGDFRSGAKSSEWAPADRPMPASQLMPSVSYAVEVLGQHHGLGTTTSSASTASGDEAGSPHPQQQQQEEQQQQVLELLSPIGEQQLLLYSPPVAKAKKKRVRKLSATGAEGRLDDAAAVVAVAAASTVELEGTNAAHKPSPQRTRRLKPPVAAEDGTDISAVAVPKKASSSEDVKPYLQKGLRPLRPPVPVPGYDSYFQACEGYCTKQSLLYEEPADVLIVNTPEVARAVVDKLMAVAASPYPSNRVNPPVSCRYFGCDTEVAFIDVSSETPIGHGAVLCLSIYGGDDLDFFDCARGVAAAAGADVSHGSAPAAPADGLPRVRQDRIWVDVWGEVELDAEGRPIMDGRYVRLKSHHPILDEFKRFFEDDSVKKVWHNYGFDRHVLENMGICCAGFGGDTLHMARLADASRSGKRTYGLDNLTADKDIMRYFVPNHLARPTRELMGNARRAARLGAAASPAAGSPDAAATAPPGGSSPGDRRAAEVAKLVRAKVSMKDRFGMVKLRNGVPGKVPELPAMQQLHSLELFRPTWIDYSALDAKATWQLREALEGRLRLEPWEMERSLARQLGYDNIAGGGGPDNNTYLHLWHFYCSYWLDFGELLTEMERRGMVVNRQHLAEAQRRAEADKAAAMREFLEWADRKVPGARYMNAHSGLQIRMLLFPDFPGYVSKAAALEASKAKAAAARTVRKAGIAAAAAVTAPVEAEVAAARRNAAAEAEVEAGSGGGRGDGGEGGDAAAPPRGCRVIKVPNPLYEEEVAQGRRSSRTMNLELHGIWGRGVPGRLPPEVLTATNAAAVSIKVLRGLAGKPGAARKELAKLLEARAAAAEAADSRAAEAAAAAAEAAARVPIVDDVLDEALQELVGTDDNGNGNGNSGLEEAEEGPEVKLEVQAQPRAQPRAQIGAQIGAQTATSKGKAASSPAASETSSETGTAATMHVGPVPVVEDVALLAALEREAKDKGLGRLYAACGGGEEGLRACIAVEALCEISAIDKLLSAFIVPLQSDATSTTTVLPAPPGSDSPSRTVHRVHCSLNINTETGRLSARRPNLQNQPALEKDRYKVRQAFTADVAGCNTLVVADYGQLELRILAHMTDCASMRKAFELGGDFHSRTAYGMYDYIQEAVRKGECYLEWEGHGEPDKPLVKDKYASERRKAKVLNFSIAYGKTAHGLAADFKTTKEEAQETVDKWYSDRWEVRKWQEDTRKSAGQEYKVRTLLGRTRPLPNINAPDFKLSGHSNRAAINTPIQGSAADVAAAAMVAIEKSEALRATGFKLLMQIHDEVILEGPRDRSGDAQRLVMALMANPWAELTRHWNAPGARGIMQGPSWRRLPPQLPGGHLAGVWRHGGDGDGGGGRDGTAGPVAGGGGGDVAGAASSDGGSKSMPLLVELATDCNVADTWYEAK